MDTRIVDLTGRSAGQKKTSEPVFVGSSQGINYSVKLMNPTRKSDFTVEKWHDKKFDTVTDFKEQLILQFDALKVSEDISLGYIEPGHGLRGRQQWINDDQDILEMYKLYQGKKEVVIWCYPRVNVAKKRQFTGESQKSVSKRSKCLEKNEEAMDNVRELVSKLQEKHSNGYSAEQYNAWAQLINIKKHQSFDEPPDYPFFRGKKGKSKSASPSMNTTIAAPACSSLNSPTKRISARSELLTQLMKINDLLEKGYITQENHDKIQSEILKDIEMF